MIFVTAWPSWGWVLGSMEAENRVKAQQHTAQEVAAIPMQKSSHKFRLLQGSFANEHVPIPPCRHRPPYFAESKTFATQHAALTPVSCSVVPQNPNSREMSVISLHNGALTTPICRSPFSERAFYPYIPVLKNPPILLVNPLQSSRSTFSQGSLLSFFAFKEGVLGTPISVLGG